MPYSFQNKIKKTKRKKFKESEPPLAFSKPVTQLYKKLGNLKIKIGETTFPIEDIIENEVRARCNKHFRKPKIHKGDKGRITKDGKDALL
jgi:hypothetical protein